MVNNDIIKKLRSPFQKIPAAFVKIPGRALVISQGFTTTRILDVVRNLFMVAVRGTPITTRLSMNAPASVD